MQWTKRHLILIGSFIAAAAIAIVLVAISQGKTAQSGIEGAEDLPIESSVAVTTQLPDDSILLFQGNEGGAKLISDMNEGRIPLECRAMYDEMGSRPEVSTTDQNTIIQLYNYLAHVRVPGDDGMFVTDCYHYVSFKLQDGTYVTYRFEDSNLVWGQLKNYAVVDCGPLWSFIRGMQDEIIYDGKSNDAEQRVAPFGLSGIVAMSDFMREQYSSFEPFDQGIQSGNSIPQSLTLYANGADQAIVTDPAIITEFWNALSNVRIDLDHQLTHPYEGSYISFSFDSGREIIPFAFSTTELAQFSRDVLYPVEDPSEVEELMTRLSGYSKAEGTSNDA